MANLKFISLAITLTLVPALGHAFGSIQAPECAVFDTVHNRYLVSSYQLSGVFAIDLNGQTSLFWHAPRGPISNLIYRDTFYVVWGESPGNVSGLNLATGSEVMRVTLPGSTYPDGITSDSSGNLWIVDAGERTLFRLRMSDRTVTKFVLYTLSRLAQDVCFDSTHNRLIIVGFTEGAPVQAYNITGGTVSTLTTTTFGQMDGIARDRFGNYYVSGHYAGKVYMYDSLFTEPPLEAVTDLAFPSNIAYNWRDHLLVIPLFGADSLALIPFDYYQDDDHDRIPAFRDNCPLVANPDQADEDRDGIGTICDVCPFDSLNDVDADGVCGDVDNCREVANQSQADQDQDGIGDVCDPCPADTANDRDADGICGSVDNCPTTANPTQLDADHDGVGDACCCTGVRGNVNYLGIVDLADLSALVSYLTGGGFVLPCPAEANVNSAGIVDLADLSALVSYLTGGGYLLPECS